MTIGKYLGSSEGVGVDIGRAGVGYGIWAARKWLGALVDACVGGA